KRLRAIMFGRTRQRRGGHVSSARAIKKLQRVSLACPLLDGAESVYIILTGGIDPACVGVVELICDLLRPANPIVSEDSYSAFRILRSRYGPEIVIVLHT